MNISKQKNQNYMPGVAITGIGIISPFGQGIPAFSQALVNSKSQFVCSERFAELLFPVIVAELHDFNFEQVLHSYPDLSDQLLTLAYKSGRRAPLTLQASLIAALEAWQQARLHDRKPEATRIGLVVAGNNTTQNYQYALRTTFQQNPNYLSPTYALHFMDTDQVGILSEVFGIQGEGFTVGGASASGNMGIIHGQRLIQQGLVDVCLVVGVLADLSPLELQGFYNIGALGGHSFQERPNQACRPFDRDHEGFIWGQASGCLVLESLEKVQVSGLSYWGKIAGSAMVLDGYRGTKSNIEGESRVMKNALIQANMSPEQIQYLNTHGTSSALGDDVEIQAIRAVFEKSIHQLWLNSTKSIVGHCLWSAGVIEAIATLLQMQNSFLHANLNLEHPIDYECRFVGQRNKEDANISTAMSNSFGFGGINTSVIFTRGG